MNDQNTGQAPDQQVKGPSSPIFAVFPFNQPDVFSYPRPVYTNLDQGFAKSLAFVEEQASKTASKLQKNSKKSSKTVKKPKKK